MSGPPQWRPLDEIAAAAPAGDVGGRIVGIVASRTAVTAGWAEGAALTLAEAWTRAGQRVILADGALERPSLHTVAGVGDGEGLSDAVLFGASVARVAREADGGYFVIPAGTAVADSEQVVRSERWNQLTRSFVEAGVTLGVFLPEGEPGIPAFLGSASEIVVLAGPDEALPASVGDLGALVTHVTGPGPAPASRTGGASAVAPTAGEVVPSEAGELSAAALKSTAAQGKGRVRLLLLLVVLLVAVLAAMLGLIEIPGLTPSAAEGASLHR